MTQSCFREVCYFCVVPEPNKYIVFCGLRKWDQLNGKLVSVYAQRFGTCTCTCVLIAVACLFAFTWTFRLSRELGLKQYFFLFVGDGAHLCAQQGHDC